MRCASWSRWGATPCCGAASRRTPRSRSATSTSRWSKADGWTNGAPFANAWRADHVTHGAALGLQLSDLAEICLEAVVANVFRRMTTEAIVHEVARTTLQRSHVRNIVVRRLQNSAAVLGGNGRLDQSNQGTQY